MDGAALDAALELSQRTLAEQMRSQEVQFGRADALVRLAIAHAGGLIAVVGFLLPQGEVDPVWATGLASAVVLNFLALVLLAYGAFGGWNVEGLKIGPDPAQVNDAVLRQGADRREVVVSLLEALSVHVSDNRIVLRRRHKVTGAGLLSLTASGVMLLTAISYIAGGRILA